jgi:LacI family transcriptional regulator, xylobiose transport system transcriptional regulator
MMAATARLSGFRAALEAARIPLHPKYVRRGEFHHSDGLTEGRALLSMPVPPTAIFASSDVQALGVYEAARALGVAIPTELSVVGFDDLKIARWAGPALTTIRVPIAEMAEQAVQVVLGLAHDRAPAFSRVDMATTLVVRDSTEVPPHRPRESFVYQSET